MSQILEDYKQPHLQFLTPLYHSKEIQEIYFPPTNERVNYNPRAHRNTHEIMSYSLIICGQSIFGILQISVEWGLMP